MDRDGWAIKSKGRETLLVCPTVGDEKNKNKNVVPSWDSGCLPVLSPKLPLTHTHTLSQLLKSFPPSTH